MFNAITVLSFALSVNVPAKFLLTFSCTHVAKPQQHAGWKRGHSQHMLRSAHLCQSSPYEHPLAPSMGNLGAGKSPHHCRVGKQQVYVPTCSVEVVCNVVSKKILRGCQKPVNQIALKHARLPWGQAMLETCVKGVTHVPGGILRVNHRGQLGNTSPTLGVFLYYLSWHWGQPVCAHTAGGKEGAEQLRVRAGGHPWGWGALSQPSPVPESPVGQWGHEGRGWGGSWSRQCLFTGSQGQHAVPCFQD